MPRIAGTTIPDNKNIWISLTYVKGIGRPLSSKILTQAGIPFEKKASQLKPEELNRIKEIIEKNYKVEGDLRREVAANIKRLKDIGAWRGLRHMKKLPVRGQRTKTNMRTVKGNVRKTMGSGRKPPASPT
ncbi:MAG: 30S ribosomal protein S13 [Candidatus Wildermuthbacteria bacterium]|nr:30S ribosomal protein S13 [Candidatus Wildermuthbacteria bacterium]